MVYYMSLKKTNNKPVLPDMTNHALEESVGFHNKQPMLEEQYCCNGEPRCKARCWDSDEYCFKGQCNINEGHDGEHRFGLDSCLYGVFPPSTCDIDNDIHDGSCSTCMIREVRGR